MNKKAFTLVELLTAIALISLIALGITSIDFKGISDKQRLDIFLIKVVAEIETVRNNSLIGKGIGTNLDVPQEWKIDFSKTGSGIINTNYTLSGATWDNYNSIKFDNFYSIDSIACGKITDNDLSNDIITSGTGTISFSQKEIKLSSDCAANQKLNIKFKYKQFEKELNFNSVNGLIETK